VRAAGPPAEAAGPGTRRRLSDPRHTGLAGAAGRWAGRIVVGGLAAFMTLPTLIVVVASLNGTEILAFPPQPVSLRWYVHALTYPQFQRAALNSALVTAGAAGLALPVGVGSVLALERARLPGRGVIRAALLSPLIIPGVVTGLGLLILGAWLGLLQSLWILITAHLIVVLPFVIRSVWVSLANADPQLERAAASLGAGPWSVFWRITLPLLRPGLVVALLFAVIVSLNEFVVSLFISTRVTEILPVAMYTYVVNYTDPTIAALSSLFILGTFALVFAADRLVDLGVVFQIARRHED
jgi:putative spermidine/putrescine transport system permease protein